MSGELTLAIGYGGGRVGAQHYANYDAFTDALHDAMHQVGAHYAVSVKVGADGRDLKYCIEVTEVPT